MEPTPRIPSTPLHYTITNVFVPDQLPDEADDDLGNQLSLARAVCTAARVYSTHVYGTSEQTPWHRVTKMLDNFQASILDDARVLSQLREMRTGDILTFLVRRHNLAVVLTKRVNTMICEPFEISPSASFEEETGSSICMYPASTVETPNEVFDDEDIRSKFANFLFGWDHSFTSFSDGDDHNAVFHLPLPNFHHRPVTIDLDDVSGLPSPPVSAGSHCMVALLTGILGGTDRTSGVPQITKRVREHHWCRSSPWLFIKVAIQISLGRSLALTSYKKFMLFFICTLAKDRNGVDLSSDLLHLMACKILRRLKKLGTSSPDWLSEMALKTCTRLRETLDTRFRQPTPRRSLFQNPSEDALARDIQLLLPRSRKYIRDALMDTDLKPIPVATPFHPSHHHRGTIEDFLSSNGLFFDEAYRADEDLALYDLEQSVEEGIDNWIACVPDVDEACAKLAILMDKYITKAEWKWEDERTRESGDSETPFIGILTAIELFVALDKLVVKEIPMLADYSPEIPVKFLETLHLRKAANLHRLSRAYQYLSGRHSRSRSGWSVLSEEFTEDSFPVRHYDRSPHLQHLRARIEEDAIRNLSAPVGSQQTLLPLSLAHTKVVVFELRCPPCLRIWRSTIPQIFTVFSLADRRVDIFNKRPIPELDLLTHAPGLQPYILQGNALNLSAEIHCGYFFPSGQQPASRTTLCYVFKNRHGDCYEWHQYHTSSPKPTYDFHGHLAVTILAPDIHEYVPDASYTSNDVLAAQADCQADLSLDEFIARGHLRSGGSLRWLNVLQGLRSRTLNLRHKEVHHLLAQVAFQVGPLDLDTGTWIWHQELQDAFFCNALLDELENLLLDVGVGLIDGVLMNNISLLLTRVLASSPGEGVSERVIAILRQVRRETFKWVEELSYNLMLAPKNEERRHLLVDMASTCRSTFDVDIAILCKVCRSAEDIDALLSCALFAYTLGPRSSFSSSESDTDKYSKLLFERDRRLSFRLEGIFRDVILADPSDRGVDLAVSKMFPAYQPGAHRWEQLLSPNTRWITCKIEPIADQPLQTIHLNLLNGELRVDGELIDGLLRAMVNCLRIVGVNDESFKAIISNFPGMDFMTRAIMSEHKIYLSLRDENLVVRAQCHQTSDIIELIPSEKLLDDIPQVLVHDHIHWLNLSTKIIEIRPVGQLWEQSSENWRIDCASGQYRAYKGRETLVDVRSPTWAMVSKCFECVTNKGPSNPGSNTILVTLSSTGDDSPSDPPTRRLSIALINYGLSFSVNEKKELESWDFKDMVYDEDQCIGTLFGLENLLVLRHKAHIAGVPIPDALTHRLVLVPDGKLSQRHDHRVQINLGDQIDRGLYHTYNVDTELGCLTENGNLMSTKYLANLHANTSCYRPDLLTGKTGAQAAHCLARSAGCRSTENLNRAKSFSTTWHVPEELEQQFNLPRGPASITLEHLLYNTPPPELPRHSTLLRDGHATTSSDAIPELNQLFTSLLIDQSGPTYQGEYISLLEQSTQRAREESRRVYRLAGKDQIRALKEHYTRCRLKYSSAMETLKKILGPTDAIEEALQRFGRWPPIMADDLLRCLASTSLIKIPPGWKNCLISLALLLLDLQRARRLLRFALDGLEEEFSKELENEVCEGWNAEDYPDWLLIQVQGNFLIRHAQAETAMAMISPKSGANTVMQVNMGDGKSSVIIPITATVLADAKQLVRVIVPKALTMQMFQLLVTRLGGLTNRPIYHLPFSRSEHDDPGPGMVTSHQIYDLQMLMSRCMAERGILLVQPEHIVSLKLMGVEKQIPKGVLATGSLPQPQNAMYKLITTAVSLTSISQDSLLGNLYQSLRQLSNRVGKNGTSALARHGDRHILDVDNAVYEPSGWAADDESRWLMLQKWIHSHARDILDESDDILHPRFQLVYTTGLEQHMDGYPNRWTITQHVLQLVRDHIHTLSINHPSAIEYGSDTPGSFPDIRIVRISDVGRRIPSLIVEDIMAGRLPNFNFQQLSSELQGAIRGFISDPNVFQIPDTIKTVEDYAKGDYQNHLWSGLLLLRGLLACNILLFALTERRWRVDYGLDLPRLGRHPHPFLRGGSEYSHRPSPVTATMLAVPYRAKDMPALDTQFGHPDITIILTCLTYYYTGLTEEQLRVAFQLLMDQDDPSTEYTRWVKYFDGESMTDSLGKLREINLEPSEQWDKVIYPLFSHNQAAIDFYLSHVVFPKEAKEFPHKIAASSWDLAEKREKLITGFSGTNDSQWLLPMSIAQRDLDAQKGTNARVLAYLLRPENDSYMVVNKSGDRWRTLTFLRMLNTQFPKICVLLDVGAQILDFSNNEVAKAWLDISRDVAGAIYFNDDELMILDRNGKALPMVSSPLSQRLDRCVVYLDHAHTRGTDLKLPIGSRAAVTLSPKLTKDSLVQGCMRMRKLGHGHSVMFFAPLEVDRNIRAVVTNKDPNARISTADILCWTIHETWIDIQQRAPYWAQQGMSHKSRYEAWSRFCNGELAPEKLSDAWLQPDTRTLADLYAPSDSENNNPSSGLSNLDPGIRQRCKTLGVLSLPSAQMEEEQEREVNREREREREMELPPSAKPAKHFLHPDVVRFVKTGDTDLLQTRNAFRPVFTTLERTTAATITREADVWSRFILGTVDFCRTIQPESTEGTLDQYLRPVQWILTRSKKDGGDQVLVLLSPFEADSLLPDIRASDYVHLHVYAPRTSRRMKPSDDLKLYSIPPLPSEWTPPWNLIDQLNVFAGQLYLRDCASYLRLCQFLGVPMSENGPSIRFNMFNIPGSFEEIEIRFSGSPLPSVMALLAMRSRGRPFTDSHMGKILRGQPLTEKDFDVPNGQNYSLRDM